MANLKDEKIFTVAEFEFGEIYHVCVACVFDSTYRIDMSLCSPSQQEFLKTVFRNQPQQLILDAAKEAKYRGSSGKEKEEIEKRVRKKLHETVDIITDHWQDDSAAFFSKRFIGDLNNDLKNKIESYLAGKLKSQGQERVIIHVRGINHQPNRNLNEKILKDILNSLNKNDEIILTGEPLSPELKNLLQKEKDLNKRVIYEWNNFYKDDIYKQDSIACQLYTYVVLQKSYGLKGIYGMKSGSLDGPAFIGIPAIFYEARKNTKSRMTKIAEKIPTFKRREFQDDLPPLSN